MSHLSIFEVPHFIITFDFLNPNPMKKSVLLSLIVLFINSFRATGQCSFTYTLSGNEIVLNYNNTLSPFFNIDSVVIDFGEGSPVLEANIPAGSSFAFSSPYTYSNIGVFVVCIYEYTSWGGSPQSPCMHCDTITVTNVGVSALKQNTLNFYPNPVANSLSVILPDHSGAMLLQLIDATGRKLCNINLPASKTGTFQLDLNNYSKGIYLLNIVTSEKNYSSRLIKE